MASLHVGRLVDLGLTVISVPQDARQALKTNLPFENPGTAEEERLAGDTAKGARIVAKCKPKPSKAQNKP